MNRYLSEFDDCLRCEELTLHCKEHSRCLQCEGCSECSPVSFDFAGERAEAVPQHTLTTRQAGSSTATTSPAEHIASLVSSGSLAGEGAAPPLGSAPVLTTADHLVQAIAQDEGEKGWNQQQINDIARKMNRIAAGGFNSLEILVSGVEEVLV